MLNSCSKNDNGMYGAKVILQAVISSCWLKTLVNSLLPQKKQTNNWNRKVWNTHIIPSLCTFWSLSSTGNTEDGLQRAGCPWVFRQRQELNWAEAIFPFTAIEGHAPQCCSIPTSIIACEGKSILNTLVLHIRYKPALHTGTKIISSHAHRNK